VVKLSSDPKFSYMSATCLVRCNFFQVYMFDLLYLYILYNFLIVMLIIWGMG
jgi:hypothetical protein